MMMLWGIDGWHNTKALWTLSVVRYQLPMSNPQSWLNKQQLLDPTLSRARCQLLGKNSVYTILNYIYYVW